MGLTARARLSRRLRTRLVDERGFTLPELLITMAILLIVIASLASVLVSSTKSAVDANTRFQAQGQARAGLDQFRREIHCATSITDTNGASLTVGTAYNAITVVLGSSCPTNVTHATTFYVTWCTTASTLTTGDFALYRVTSTALPRPTCATSGKVKWADYLQPTTLGPPPASTPFCLPSTGVACSGVLRPTTSLPMLHVTMPVDLKGPTATIDKYNLVDDIALRNGTRS
jgi:prepilin-type N-terminal cleavage/methylation domain-containing protein